MDEDFMAKRWTGVKINLGGLLSKISLNKAWAKNVHFLTISILSFVGRAPNITYFWALEKVLVFSMSIQDYPLFLKGLKIILCTFNAPKNILMLLENEKIPPKSILTCSTKWDAISDSIVGSSKF